MKLRRGVISIRHLLVLFLAAYGFFLPFEELIVLPTGSLLGLLGIIIMALCLMLKTTYTIDRLFLYLILWLTYSAVSVLWTSSYMWWKYNFMIYAGQTVFLFLTSQQYLEREDLCFIKKGLIAGTLIAALIIILFPVQATFTSEGRRTLLIADMKMDPNILSAILIIGFYSCIDLFFHRELKKKSILVLFLTILAVGIVFTGSRGGAIALIVSAFYMLFFLVGKKREQKQKYFLWIMGLAVLLVAVYWLLPENALFHRFDLKNLFGQDDYRNGAHNRYAVWKKAFVLFLRRPLFGYGCGGFFQAITEVYFRRTAAHNMFILELVELGLVGLALIGLVFISVIRVVRKSREYADRGLLMAILVISMTLDTLGYKYLWVTLLFVLLSGRIEEAEKAVEDLTVQEGERSAGKENLY